MKISHLKEKIYLLEKAMEERKAYYSSALGEYEKLRIKKELAETKALLEEVTERKRRRLEKVRRLSKKVKDWVNSIEIDIT